MLVRSSLPRQRLRNDEGSIIVAAAIGLLAIAMLGAVLVQVGSWFQHRRHIQVRADAAALAGGDAFNDCFAISGGAFTTASADADIEKWARGYGGLSGGNTPPYNPQFGTSSADLMSFQSDQYPSASTPTPPRSTILGNECDTLKLDVKMTQEGIPALFSFSPLATTHGWARVELQKITSAKPSLPLAVPDVDPKQVDATFVNEGDGSELTGCSGTALVPGTTCSFYLTKQVSSGGLTPWTGSAGVTLPTAPANVGVRVGLGGSTGSCANTTGGANFACYDINHTKNGLVMIRDYATGGNGKQPNSPVPYGVWPSSVCSGSPFFADFNVTSTSPSCNVGLEADVDFGTGSTNPTLPATKGGVGAVLTATVNGQTVTMAPDHYDSSIPGWVWTGGTNIPVDANAATSQYPIALNWEEHEGRIGSKNCTTGQGCTGSFSNVQRFTAATDDDDGPVKGISLADATPGAKAPYSLTSGTHTLVVTVLLEGNLSVKQPPQEVNLRLTGNGSRTTAANCDADLNGNNGNQAFQQALLNGCQTPYQENTDDLCPDPNPPAGAADCVPIQTGNLGQTVINSLNQRFSPCPTNNWPNTAVPRDPRVIVVMITDYSALGIQGTGDMPVTNFASFYLMGWSSNNCGDNWPFPYAEPSGGNIWGYFINYTTGYGTPSGTTCQVGSITPCIPALTR